MVAEFFQAEAGELARACHAMARAFERGGTLIPFGAGPAATDAAHAAVEFMHPVIVGKRALPAIAPSNDPTGATTLSKLSGPDDIALAISHGAPGPETARFIEAARARGLLTIAMTGAEAEHLPGLTDASEGGYRFEVPSRDPVVVQETQETAYHVLWELVHVFFEQPGLLEEAASGAREAGDPEACITCGDVAVTARVVEIQGPTAVIEKDGAFEQVAIDLVEGVQRGDMVLCHAGVALEIVPDEPTDSPYPLQGSGATDLDSMLADVGASTLEKAGEVTALRAVIDTGAVARAADKLRQQLDAGARLLAFGNGGSASDAQDLATDVLARGWPALALNNDAATVTAVANDVGTEHVFARQLIALGRPGDIAVAISTSGGSPNAIAAIEEAHRRGLVTVALTGYEGGRLAALDALDHLFVVPSDHIPRIQEAQATIYHLLLEAIGDRGGPPGV